MIDNLKQAWKTLKYINSYIFKHFLDQWKLPYYMGMQFEFRRHILNPMTSNIFISFNSKKTCLLLLIKHIHICYNMALMLLNVAPVEIWIPREEGCVLLLKLWILLLPLHMPLSPISVIICLITFAKRSRNFPCGINPNFAQKCSSFQICNFEHFWKIFETAINQNAFN